LLMKSSMRFDGRGGLSFNLPRIIGNMSSGVENGEFNPKEQSFQMGNSLGGSMLGLNSSSTPLSMAPLNGKVDLLTGNGKEENSIKKKSEKESKEGKERTTKRKGRAQEEKLEMHNENFITNGQILKRSKHYSIQFVKVAKILITTIFLIYIIFIVSNVITNTMYLADIDSNMALVSSFVMKFPAATRLYNVIRLMIIENDVSYVNHYSDYMLVYDLASKDSDILYNNFKTGLPNTFNFYDVLNSQDYAKRAALVCVESFQKDVCNSVLKKENGYNKEGFKIAATTVIQSLNNIYKDYLKLYESGNVNMMKGLASRETLLRYFYNEEFANVNIEMEYILQQSTEGYFEAIYLDMTSLFDQVINLDLLLGVISICLNIFIILYLVFGFFSRLKQSMSYISYSAKKFNRALFEM
jgi:hypothetical protein